MSEGLEVVGDEGYDLLRTVIDENPNIILLKDWNGKFILGNRALANLYGTTPNELVGKDDGAFNPNREQVEFYLQNVREIMSQNETRIVMEESTDAVTGETHYYQSIKKPLLAPDGSPQILVIATDVTDLRRAKNDLEESERRLQYVLDVTQEGIWDWDIRSGTVTHNVRWCKLLGFDERYARHPFEIFSALVHQEDVSRVRRSIEACLSNGGPYRSEHRMHRSDGATIWVLDRGDVVERDEAGNALRMVGSVIDISERILAAQELERRESYLRATLDNFPFMIWLKDGESRFLTVNRRFAEASGRSDPDSVVGLSDLDLWPEELALSYRSDDQEVMQSQREKFVEEPLEAEGTRIWIETYKHPVFAPTGEVIGTVGFARDVTERHQMAQALANSELRWQLALEGNNDGIWDWNIKDGAVFYSTRWKSMLGFSEEELPNQLEEWRSRVHPDDIASVMDAIDAHLAGHTAFYQTEHRLKCKDGGYKWILDRGKAIFDADGKPLRMVGSHTDITDRRDAEMALQDRNEQLDTIFALSPDGLISFDNQGLVKYANPAFSTLVGLELSEVMGLSESKFVKLMSASCQAGTVFLDLSTQKRTIEDKGDSKKRAETIHIARTGKVLEMSLRSCRSHTLSRIVYFRDVTYEWEVAQIKSEFLSTAAHELRTPMASIYGYTELLLNRSYPEGDRKEMLEVVFRQSALVNSIINELLDISRIEARRGKDFVYKKNEAREVCQEVSANFNIDGHRPLILQMPDTPLFFNVDRSKIGQALSNVLSNAYKYSPGGGDVMLSLASEVHDAVHYCVMRITDHGIGMTKGQVARVCERFYRADTSGSIPGTGLGMSIVKEIVELHRGKLHIASTLGVGTTVSIFIPAI
ncbi:PAS domain S-box protein [Ferriphaselus sp. R-1]|uniref:PAS domain S-box protein n=1 Tax=Ferriphaselus sp. R-1 TaxID=1485544 RepID=UPI00068BFCF0|nr:PAS domain S-box protein [Ferriphaselus sp. R-1]